MTLIDVDGYLAPDELAVRGAAKRRAPSAGSTSAARSGSTCRRPAARRRGRQAAEAIDAHLPQPFERTAVNGFGFVQIVRPRTARLADRACPGSRRVRSPRAAAPRGVRTARAETARRASCGDRRDRAIPAGSTRSRGRSAARSSLRADACASHVGRVCRKPSNKPKNCPLCGKPESPSMRPSAAAAARTATC